VVEDEREPWWASNSQLIEIRRRTLEEFDRELEQREPKAGCSGSLCPATTFEIPSRTTSHDFIVISTCTVDLTLNPAGSSASITAKSATLSEVSPSSADCKSCCPHTSAGLL
jgi:hypothetical protein